MKRIITLAAALVLMSGAAFGQFSLAGSILGDSAKSTPSLGYPVASVRGYGGQHIAYTSGVHTLFVNPAELAYNKGEFNLSTIDLSVLNVNWLIEAINVISEGLSDGFDLSGGSIPDGLADLFTRTEPFGFELRGPLNIAWAGKGWGVGLWERFWTDDTGTNGLGIKVNFYIDVILNGGMAFPVYQDDFMKASVGFTAKAFARAGVKINLDLMDILGSMGSGDDLMSALGNTFDLPVMIGGGVDLGASVHMNLLGDLVAAFTIQDLFTMASSVGDLGSLVGSFLPGGAELLGGSSKLYAVPTLFNIGVAWKPDMSFVGNWITAAVFADYKDLAGAFMTPTLTSRHPILNLSFGLEVGFLGFVYVRAGMAEMLPSLGLGLDLFICEIDLSVYGRELGKDPGDNPSAAIDFSLRFAF